MNQEYIETFRREKSFKITLSIFQRLGQKS